MKYVTGLVVLLVLLSVLTGCHRDARVDCVGPLPSATFLQIYNIDRTRPAAEWDARFARLRALGFSEIILQWTRYDQYDFATGERPGATSLVERIIRAAAHQGLRVWIGLHHDSAWWRVPTLDNTGLAAYLDQRLATTRTLVSSLWEALQAIPDTRATLAGWYITDELDDHTWASPERTALLRNYLHAVTDAVRAGPVAEPILISAFSNGTTPPEQIAADWLALLASAQVNGLLFQDGLGAGKLDLNQFEAYASALEHAFAKSGHTLHLITELFQSDPKQPVFKAEAAAPERIARQLRIAAHLGIPTVAFSAPDYLLEGIGSSTLRDWWARQQACR